LENVVALPNFSPVNTDQDAAKSMCEKLRFMWASAGRQAAKILRPGLQKQFDEFQQGMATNRHRGAQVPTGLFKLPQGNS